MKKYVCNESACYLDTGTQSIPTKNDSTDFPFPSQYGGWVIYGADWCRYCKNAMIFLTKNRASFIYYDVNCISVGGTQNLIHNLKPFIGTHNTIPIIFYNDVFIGGYTELLDKFKK